MAIGGQGRSSGFSSRAAGATGRAGNHVIETRSRATLVLIGLVYIDRKVPLASQRNIVRARYQTALYGHNGSSDEDVRGTPIGLHSANLYELYFPAEMVTTTRN